MAYDNFIQSTPAVAGLPFTNAASDSRAFSAPLMGKMNTFLSKRNNEEILNRSTSTNLRALKSHCVCRRYDHSSAPNHYYFLRAAFVLETPPQLLRMRRIHHHHHVRYRSFRKHSQLARIICFHLIAAVVPACCPS